MSRVIHVYGPIDANGGFLNSEESYFGHGVIIDPMPTALVAIYTQQGFVLASDGQGNPITGGVSAEECKIFRINCPKHPQRKLAYGIAGTASLLVDDAEGKMDVFKQIYQDALKHLDDGNFNTLPEYVDRFVDLVRPQMHSELKRGGQRICLPSRRNPSTGYSTKFCFAGYFDENTPSLVVREISFWYDKWCVANLREYNPANPSAAYFWGSEKVGKCLRDPNPESKFKKFHAEEFNKIESQNLDISIDGAKTAARQYVGACKSREGREEDPEYCKAIGGKTFTGTITPQSGFEGEWDTETICPS